MNDATDKEPSDAGRAGSISAEVQLPSADLTQDMPFFIRKLGFRLDKIFPADNPAVAILSGHGLTLRLQRGAAGAPGTIRLLCDDPDGFAEGETLLTAPNGTRIEIVEAKPPLVMPDTFMDQDSPGRQIELAGLTCPDIVATAMAALGVEGKSKSARERA